MTSEKPAVLVLGGHGDIGAAIAERFRSEGHAVTAAGRKLIDLTDPESVDRWFDEDHPPIGVLIHSAGLNLPKEFAELTQEEIDVCFETNVRGFVHVVRRAIPELVASEGRVVVLSSIYGFLSRVGRLPYSMSKHALVGIVKSLALELAPNGVLVNALSPGYINTRLTWQNNDATTIERMETAIPLHRMGTPGEIAEVAYFLGSSMNGYVTGQDIVVDGGFSIDGGRF